MHPPVDCDPLKHLHIAFCRQRLSVQQKDLSEKFHLTKETLLSKKIVAHTCQGREGRRRYWAADQGGEMIFGRGPEQSFINQNIWVLNNVWSCITSRLISLSLSLITKYPKPIWTRCPSFPSLSHHITPNSHGAARSRWSASSAPPRGRGHGAPPPPELSPAFPWADHPPSSSTPPPVPPPTDQPAQKHLVFFLYSEKD